MTPANNFGLDFTKWTQVLSLHRSGLHPIQICMKADAPMENVKAIVADFEAICGGVR